MASFIALALAPPPVLPPAGARRFLRARRGFLRQAFRLQLLAARFGLLPRGLFGAPEGLRFQREPPRFLLLLQLLLDSRGFELLRFFELSSLPPASSLPAPSAAPPRARALLGLLPRGFFGAPACFVLEREPPRFLLLLRFLQPACFLLLLRFDFLLLRQRALTRFFLGALACVFLGAAAGRLLFLDPRGLFGLRARSLLRRRREALRSVSSRRCPARAAAPVRPLSAAAP